MRWEMPRETASAWKFWTQASKPAPSLPPHCAADAVPTDNAAPRLIKPALRSFVVMRMSSPPRLMFVHDVYGTRHDANADIKSAPAAF
ncbi:hypothetical protein GCM10008170_36240 [Methylopila capsulata]|uniref:Uncharacterized protein n=1 Tax=Methylopila capsulata TaxID=61654 RepID=A0A9W6IXX2_9HYPH|nr:hypothetical protein GCM10008170_36240 [Methylopila capsulata]